MRDTLVELANDIQALDDGDPARWLTQPSIARRAAAEVARAVPAGTDRIVATGDCAELLGQSVALVTGLPVAVLGADGRMRGDRHPGEATFTVAVTDAPGCAADLVLIGTASAVRSILRISPDGLVAENRWRSDPQQHPTIEEQ